MLLKQGGKLSSSMNQQDPLHEDTNSEAAQVNYDNYYERYAPILSFPEQNIKDRQNL